MKSSKRAWLPFIVLAASSAWVSASPSPPPAPRPSADAFGLLRFHTSQGPLENHCMGFITRIGSHRVLVTVLQVFGPNGGMKSQIPAREIPELVAYVDLLTPGERIIDGAGKRELLREGQSFRDGRSGDATGDLLAFKVPASVRAGTLTLAKSNPAKGSWVYVLAWHKLRNGKARLLPFRLDYSGALCFSAKVSKSYVTKGLSGCPVLNRKGEVVGMYVGHVTTDKEKYLVFNPVQSMYARISRSYLMGRRR